MTPQAGRKCSICAHPQASAINLALGRDRGSKSEVAVRFGVSESSVQRHRANHLGLGKTPTRGPKNKTAGNAAPNARFDSDGRCPTCDQLTGEGDEALEPKHIVKRAERILHVSESIALKAQDDNDARLSLLAVDRCQRSIDTLARIAGLLKPETTIIDNRTQNLYAGWSTPALQALDVFHSILASTQDVRAAIDAVAAVQNEMAPALPRPQDDEHAA